VIGIGRPVASADFIPGLHAVMELDQSIDPFLSVTGELVGNSSRVTV
jgi:hypothetical protein